MADDDVEHGVNQITIDFIVFEEDARVEDEVAFIVDVVFKDLYCLLYVLSKLEDSRFIVIVQDLRCYQTRIMP